MCKKYFCTFDSRSNNDEGQEKGQGSKIGFRRWVSALHCGIRYFLQCDLLYTEHFVGLHADSMSTMVVCLFTDPTLTCLLHLKRVTAETLPVISAAPSEQMNHGSVKQ